MKRSPEYLWVVEQIKVILCQQCDGISDADTCELDMSKCPVLKDAPDQILAIPEILIKKDKQELPVIKPLLKDFGSNDSIYEESQQDMLKDNWIKVVEK